MSDNTNRQLQRAWNMNSLILLQLQDNILRPYSSCRLSCRHIKINKNISHKQMHRVLSSILTHSYMFRPCWVIFRENFLLSWSRPGGRDTESSRLQKQRSTQSTAHSHSTIKCNLSVTITKSFLEDDPVASKHVGVCYN
jgi:hypothetical protein